jgi:hypothetical protein
MSKMANKEGSKPKPAPPPPKVDPRLITFAEKAKKSYKGK